MAKKRNKKIKKLLFGTPESPESWMANQRKNIDIMQAKAQNTPWLDAVFMAAMAARSMAKGKLNSTTKQEEDYMSSEAADFMNERGGAQKMELPNFNFGELLKAELGIKTKESGKVEVEGGEVIKTEDGTVSKVKGPKHKNGGVNINLPKNATVFSDVLGFAEEKEKRVKQLKKIENKLKNNPNDKTLINTLNRLKQVDEIEDEKAVKIQTLIKTMTELNSNNDKMSFGSSIKNFNWDKIFGKDFHVGNLLSNLGVYYGMTQQRKNTLANREGDTANKNTFKDVGNKSIRRLEETKKAIKLNENEANKQIDSSVINAMENSRNNTRSLNTLRGLDLLTYFKQMGAKEKLAADTQKSLISADSKIADFEMKHDIYSAEGEKYKLDSDKQDRDAFYSQLSKNISTEALGMQTIGANLNRKEEEDFKRELINMLSKYGYKIK